MLLALVVGSGWYTINTWHYQPLKEQAILISGQASSLRDKQVIIGNLSVQIQTLIEENRVTGFEEFYKGYQDENISDSTDSRFIF